jgi:DNA-binding NarL/FixJ family response regulator
VLVVDDHPALVFAVASFLSEQGFEVLGPADNGDSAIAVAAETHPDLALVDYRMPRTGGTTLVRRLLEASPGTRIAVYTADADQALVADVLAAGASAVVLKEAPLADLVRALTSILEGRRYVDAALAGVLAPGQARPYTLTAREVDVLRLIADGFSHDQIGERLRISAETARTHLRKACDRLGASTRTEAVAKAIRLGLIA